ncbi:MAG TPA: helix-turn-helix domain-containing protein [Solirubrobacterales bacterium]|nr:helix-turn-helix domain-containing protein [Solirubrobacterales bacterium]
MAPSSSELISAVRHPTRRRILRAYLERPNECVSARQLAPTMEQAVGQVDYHLKTLARYEILRPVRNGDGPDEHAYGWALDVEAEWLRLVLDVWVESERSR